jgi:hypothetical protein
MNSSIHLSHLIDEISVLGCASSPFASFARVTIIDCPTLPISLVNEVSSSIFIAYNTLITSAECLTISAAVSYAVRHSPIACILFICTFSWSDQQALRVLIPVYAIHTMHQHSIVARSHLFSHPLLCSYDHIYP